jgi:uncharacterized protein with PIN domain
MRFLLDGMLGRLARWLRMIGCDASYSKDSSDNVLLLRAKQESFVLLTSDVQLYRAAIAKDVECFLVEGQDEPERLASLALKFNLKLEIDTTNSRCPVCGSPIKLISKDEVTHLVPPATFNVYESFWICTNASCAKVYWQGSHWKRIEETLEKAREIFERKRHQLRENSAISFPRGRSDTGESGTSSHN